MSGSEVTTVLIITLFIIATVVTSEPLKVIEVTRPQSSHDLSSYDLIISYDLSSYDLSSYGLHKTLCWYHVGAFEGLSVGVNVGQTDGKADGPTLCSKGIAVGFDDG